MGRGDYTKMAKEVCPDSFFLIDVEIGSTRSMADSRRSKVLSRDARCYVVQEMASPDFVRLSLVAGHWRACGAGSPGR